MAVKDIFDVVDENDNIIRQEERSIVHRDKLLHRAVHVFVFNADGQLYLQRRSMRKDTAPGKWVSSCSGHVDTGEDYDTAAVRELAEEIGLSGELELTRVFKESPCKQTGYEFVYVYTCQSDGPFTLDPSEVIEGRWIHLQELNDWLERSPRDFAWSFSHLWAKFLALKGGESGDSG
jgi:isopentenyl-diphosphate delta-isomerase type 1